MRLAFSAWRMLFILALCGLAIVWSIPTFMPGSAQISWLPKQKVNLGLDLRGGAYLLLEVDVYDFLHEQLRAEAEQLSNNLRKRQINHTLRSITDLALLYT